MPLMYLVVDMYNKTVYHAFTSSTDADDYCNLNANCIVVGVNWN